MKKETILSRQQMRSVFGGEDLRKLRNDACYTQEYISRKLGISQSTYQRLESGEINISLDRIIKISTIFDKNIDNLLAGSKKKNNEDVENELECLRNIIIRQEKYIVKLEEIIKLKNE